MDENQNEEILLATDKDDRRKLKAVYKAVSFSNFTSNVTSPSAL